METEYKNTLVNFRSFLILVLVAISLCLTGKTFAAKVLPNIGSDVELCCNDETLKLDLKAADKLYSDIEEEYTLTDWMLKANNENWSITASRSSDEEITLEEWMLDASNAFWSHSIVTDYEDEIKLEEWMLDASVWKYKD